MKGERNNLGGKLVTLIAPCWNAERFIGRFLDSVLAQTYKDIQFILVNDGSNDRTDEIIQTYAEKLKRRQNFLTLTRNAGFVSVTPSLLTLRRARKYVI